MTCMGLLANPDRCPHTQEYLFRHECSPSVRSSNLDNIFNNKLYYKLISYFPDISIKWSNALSIICPNPAKERQARCKTSPGSLWERGIIALYRAPGHIPRLQCVPTGRATWARVHHAPSPQGGVMARHSGVSLSCRLISLYAHEHRPHTYAACVLVRASPLPKKTMPPLLSLLKLPLGPHLLVHSQPRVSPCLVDRKQLWKLPCPSCLLSALLLHSPWGSSDQQSPPVYLIAWGEHGNVLCLRSSAPVPEPRCPPFFLLLHGL